MDLRGKTREQIEAALANKSRAKLLDLLYSLVTIEQFFKPAEIAARTCLNKRAVLRDIRDGKFGDYYCRAENSIAVPASGVNAWRQSFRVPGTKTGPFNQSIGASPGKKARPLRLRSCRLPRQQGIPTQLPTSEVNRQQ